MIFQIKMKNVKTQMQLYSIITKKKKKINTIITINNLCDLILKIINYFCWRL